MGRGCHERVGYRPSAPARLSHSFSGFVPVALALQIE
jgi:hypothetical protein